MATNHENEDSMSSQSSSQSSGTDNNGFDSSTNDESSDEEFACFDEKLNYINITKIDTKLFMKGKTIKDVNKLNIAKDIIKQIIDLNITKQKPEVVSGRKRKSPNSLPSTKAKYAKLVSNDDDSESSAETDRNVPTTRYEMDIKKLPLKRKVSRMLKNKGIDFKLSLFLVANMKGTSFSSFFSKMVTEECRPLFLRGKEVIKSYLLFFYRNIKKERCVTPEIFALTTGYARHLVAKFADRNFVTKIEGRVLSFPFQMVSWKYVSGPVSMVTKSARPGHEILLSILDFLGILVKTRTRQIRKDSSLYKLSNYTFLTKNGKQVQSKFRLSEKCVKIQRKLSISQFGELLQHFSKISSNERTYLTNGKREKTDPRFIEYRQFLSPVTDKKLTDDLDIALCESLHESMNGTNTDICLMHHKNDKWMAADEFKLQIPHISGSLKKTRYNTINTWQDFPTLDKVIKTLKCEHGVKDFKREWLDNVMITFSTEKAPLKECIFTQYSSHRSIETYLFNHGQWLKIKYQYLSLVERAFVELLRSHLLKSDQLPFLLPWKRLLGRDKSEKNSNESKSKNRFQLEPFDRSMKPKWENHFREVCKGKTFENVFQRVRKLHEKNSSDVLIDFSRLSGFSIEKRAAYLYGFLECKLNEDSYNSAHTLLNMILPKKSDLKMITCDKKLTNGIELCDILVFNQETTYFVHVKREFSGESIRAVCSQIRHAANYIYRAQTSSGGIVVIEDYWEELNKESNDPATHENYVKEVLANMSKEEFLDKFKMHGHRDIVFVLACLDTRTKEDFSTDTNPSSDAYVVNRIQKIFPNTYLRIVDRLKQDKFLSDKGGLTNKFVLKGKNKKCEFTNRLIQWDCIWNKKEASMVFEALMSGLSRSKSTIAKMEIIKLIKDFERFYVGEKKLHLKVFSIPKDFSE